MSTAATFADVLVAVSLGTIELVGCHVNKLSVSLVFNEFLSPFHQIGVYNL